MQMKWTTAIGALNESFPLYIPLVRAIGLEPAILLSRVLWKQQDKDAWAELTQEQIEADTGLSPHLQRQARKKLKALGLLNEKENRLQHRHFYQVDHDALDRLSEAQIESPEVDGVNSGKCPPLTSTRGPKTGTKNNSTEVKNLPPISQSGVQAQVHSAPRFDPAAVRLPEDLDTKQFRNAWGDWCQHRVEIKHRLTPKTVEQQLKKCVGMGAERAVLAIENSIAGGWQGIFEPKKEWRERQPVRDNYNDRDFDAEGDE